MSSTLLSWAQSRILFSVALLLVVFAVFIVPVHSGKQAGSTTASENHSYATFSSSELDEVDERAGSDSDTHRSLPASIVLQVEHGTSLTIYESARTSHLWALCFIFCVLSGAGLMVIYNVNAIATAVGVQPSTFFVSLIAIANGVGRLAAGICSDYVVKHTSCSRLHLLSLTAAIMSAAHGILSVGHPSALLPAFLAVGFLFGCTVSLVALITVDLFGPKYIATNFGFVDTSPIFGSFIFATLVVNGFYEHNTVDDQGVRSSVGAGCFQWAFVVNATMCAVAALLALFLHRRNVNM